MIRIGFFILFVQLFCLHVGYAQTNQRTQSGNAGTTSKVAPMQPLMTTVKPPENITDDLGWELPPLQTLIDSAMVHSSVNKMADLAVLMSEYSLEEARRRWVRYVNISGSARWGSSIDIARLMNQSEELINDLNYNNRQIVSYGAGFSMYLPLTEIFDRKRPIKTAQITISQAKIQKEDAEKQIRSNIIATYYDLLNMQKTYKIQAEMYTSISMYYEQAKSDYEENKIDLAAYTQAYDSYLTAQATYESQKNMFLKAIHMLEEVVGFKLIK